ncbi:MAG: sensor histidine kinase [Alphaproteobacteria bacterium]|nr:sensor histidine kinase [Alphaproteobacteria bacterium]MDA7983793.1 sensor histidine kinase [Alphaproteobacteria bacterium]MDA7989446.1 sensor histidine kinase [Alphaproteobacteria bacterium]
MATPPPRTLPRRVADKFRGLPRALDSPLARQMLALNVLAIIVPILGILFLGGYGGTLAEQEKVSARRHAETLASVIQRYVVEVDDDGVPRLDRARLAPLFSRGVLHGGQLFLYSDGAAGEVAATSALIGPGRFSVLFYAGAALERDSDRPLSPWQTYVLDTFLGERPRDLPATITFERLLPLEVMEALPGFSPVRLRRSSDGLLAVLAATPVATVGDSQLVLLFARRAGNLDALLLEQLRNVALISFLTLFASVMLTVLMFARFAMPIRRLAAAAERLRPGAGGVAVIPQYDARQDEIGELSAALRRMVEAVEGRVRAAENFTADLAHEVKNPLASLLNAASLLSRGPGEAERARLCDLLLTDVRRLNGLMQEILASSRLESDLLAGRREEVVLRDLVSGVMDLLGRVSGEGAGAGDGDGDDDGDGDGVRFAVELPEGGCVIFGDGDRIAESLRNLVLNAVSFSPGGGVVRVVLSEGMPAVRGMPAEFAGEVSGREGYWISVEDGGAGIAPGRERRIFERFYTERAGGGGEHYGLGLSSVMQVARAHGGVVWGENREGGGAGFYLFLPVCRTQN